MLSLVKELCKLYKEKREEEKVRAQLVKAELNYELLEKIASKNWNKKVTVQIGEALIVVEPKDFSKTGYKSFKDQFEEAHR